MTSYYNNYWNGPPNGKHRASQEDHHPGANRGADWRSGTRSYTNPSPSARMRMRPAYGGSSADFGELGIGEIFGVRRFMLNNGALYPVAHTEMGPWLATENHARCCSFYTGFPGPHEAPVPTCGCGFYAYNDHAYTMEYQGVMGIIAGSGRVVIGSKGFRVEKARIVALVDPGLFTPSIARQYPTALWYPDRYAMLKAHPLTPPPQ